MGLVAQIEILNAKLSMSAFGAMHGLAVSAPAAAQAFLGAAHVLCCVWARPPLVAQQVVRPSAMCGCRARILKDRSPTCWRFALRGDAPKLRCWTPSGSLLMFILLPS